MLCPIPDACNVSISEAFQKVYEKTGGF